MPSVNQPLADCMSGRWFNPLQAAIQRNSWLMPNKHVQYNLQLLLFGWSAWLVALVPKWVTQIDESNSRQRSVRPFLPNWICIIFSISVNMYMLKRRLCYNWTSTSRTTTHTENADASFTERNPSWSFLCGTRNKSGNSAPRIIRVMQCNQPN